MQSTSGRTSPNHLHEQLLAIDYAYAFGLQVRFVRPHQVSWGNTRHSEADLFEKGPGFDAGGIKASPGLPFLYQWRQPQKLDEIMFDLASLKHEGDVAFKEFEAQSQSVFNPMRLIKH